jgi:hypothetical protein
MNLFKVNPTTMISTPIYVGLTVNVVLMQKCKHEFVDEPSTAQPHDDLTMMIQRCRCGAARSKLTGTEEAIRAAFP